MLTGRTASLGIRSEVLLACHAPLYQYARSLSRDEATAEDLVQETFRRALAANAKPANAKPANATLENVRPWMFTIMRNLWYNQVRQRMHDPTSSSAAVLFAPADPETPEHVLHRKIIHSEVRHALEALPETWREVIMLREIESMSYAEIASIIQCPVGTVMSRLSRGRALLRELLANLDAGPRTRAKGVGR